MEEAQVLSASNTHTHTLSLQATAVESEDMRLHTLGFHFHQLQERAKPVHVRGVRRGVIVGEGIVTGRGCKGISGGPGRGLYVDPGAVSTNVFSL